MTPPRTSESLLRRVACWTAVVFHLLPAVLFGLLALANMGRASVIEIAIVLVLSVVGAMSPVVIWMSGRPKPWRPWALVPGILVEFVIVIVAIAVTPVGLPVMACAFLGAVAICTPPGPRFVGDDICQSCGYDLTGLPSPTACPECGAPRA